MSNVFCFGEILLRLSPVLQGEWLRQRTIPAFVGGSELNVAAALAKWNVPVMYCSAAPDNYLSHEIITDLQQKGINTSAFHFAGSRLGIYYLPQGADLKHTGVIYDRAKSSFAGLKPGMINWNEVLKDVSWFHFSAISAALCQDAADVCEEAVKAASAKKITISVDLNYRGQLWQYKKRPFEIMPLLVKYCDVVMGNVWSANTLLGIDVDQHIHQDTSKEAYLKHSLRSSREIQQKFPKCKTVANTFRFDYKQEGIRYFTALYQNDEQVASQEYYAEKIIDKVGSGDCFMAGLIYGLYKKHDRQQLINFAASAAFGKLFEPGDVTSQNIETINKRL